MNNPKTIHIYTDGASKGNPGPGGYGVVMFQEGTQHYKELAQGFNLTTNNRMELLAVIVALEQLKSTEHPVKVFSDSKYVVDAINSGWLANWIKKDFKKVKNPDLWKRFSVLYQKYKPEMIWVKGHNDIRHNERCDALAVKAATAESKTDDTGYISQ